MQIVENDICKIGGNSFLVWGGQFFKWIGSFLTEIGEKWITKGKPTLISNPEVNLYNPFLLIVQFTVNGTEKYQIALNGNFVEKWKNDKDLTSLTEDERFLIVTKNTKLWFKKELIS